MIFYSQKSFGNNGTLRLWCDRPKIGRQIYRNFLHTGAVTKADAAQPKTAGNAKFSDRISGVSHSYRSSLDKGNNILYLPNATIIVSWTKLTGRNTNRSQKTCGRLPNAQYLPHRHPALGRERRTNACSVTSIEYNFSNQSMTKQRCLFSTASAYLR